MERITFDYGHQSTTPEVVPPWPQGPRYPHGPPPSHAPSPLPSSPTKSNTEVNGKSSDPNISEKISKLITRLPQLGKSIRIKKKGEYIPLPVPEKNENEENGNDKNENDIDMKEIQANASYWTGNDDDDEDEDDYVPCYRPTPISDADREDELEPPTLDEPYVPEEPGTRAGSTDKDAPSLFERFAYLDPSTRPEAEPSPPVLEMVDQKSSDKISIKDSDSTHSREMDCLTIDETVETEHNNEDQNLPIEKQVINVAYDDLLKDGGGDDDNLNSGLNHGSDVTVTLDVRTEIGMTSDDVTTLQKSSESAKCKIDLPDGMSKARVSETVDEKKKHHKTDKKHHHKEERGRRNDSGDRKEHQKHSKHHGHRDRERSSSKDKESKKHSRHHKDKSQSPDKRERDNKKSSDSDSSKDRKKESGKDRHESGHRKDRDEKRKDHKNKHRDRDSSRENEKKDDHKSRDKSHSEERNEHRKKKERDDKHKSKEKVKMKDPTQKLIVDTFDFFSLPVMKPKAEVKIPIDARRTVKLPSSVKDDAVPSTSKMADSKNKENTPKLESKPEANTSASEKTDKESAISSNEVRPEKCDDTKKSTTDKERSKKEQTPEPSRATDVDSLTREEKSNRRKSSRHSTPEIPPQPVIGKDAESKKKNELAKKAHHKTSTEKSPVSESDLANNSVCDAQKDQASSSRDKTITAVSEPPAQTEEKLKNRKGKRASLPEKMPSKSDDLHSSDEEKVDKKSLKRKIPLSGEMTPLLGHKRSSNLGGIRRNQIGKHTPKMAAKQRRTTLDRDEGDHVIPGKEKGGLLQTFVVDTKPKPKAGESLTPDTPECKKESEIGRDETKTEVPVRPVTPEMKKESEGEVLSGTRPFRIRSQPVRYSPTRPSPKVTPKSTPLATPTDTPKKIDTTEATPGNDTETTPIPVAVTPRPSSKSVKKSRQSKSAQSANSNNKPFSDLVIEKDSIPKPYLAFLLQRRVAHVVLRSSVLSSETTVLKVDPDAPLRFMWPSTIFPGSMHGYVLNTHKKKLPAGARAFSGYAWNGSPLSPMGAARRRFNKSPGIGTPKRTPRSPAPNEVTESQPKSPLKKVLKSPLKSPLKGLKSPGKDAKRSPIKLKLCLKKAKSGDKSQTVEAVIGANQSNDMGAIVDEKLSAEKKEEVVDVQLSGKKSKKSSSKSAKSLPTVEATTTPTPCDPKDGTPKPSPKSPKKVKLLKSPPSVNKLSPLLKSKKQSKTPPSVDKKQTTLFPLIKPGKNSTKTELSPLKTALKKIEKESRKETIQPVASTSQILDAVASITEPDDANNLAGSKDTDSEKAESIVDILDCVSDEVTSRAVASITGPDLDLVELDQTSLQEVIRTLELDLDPGKLPGLENKEETERSVNQIVRAEHSTDSSNSSDAVSKTPSAERIVSKPRRTPKLPQKLQGDVILPPQIKMVRTDKSSKFASQDNAAARASGSGQSRSLLLPKGVPKVSLRPVLPNTISAIVTRTNQTPQRIVIQRPIAPNTASLRPTVDLSKSGLVGQPQIKIISKKALQRQHQNVQPKTIEDLFKMIQQNSTGQINLTKKINDKKTIPPRKTIPKEKKQRGRPVAPKLPTTPGSPRSSVLNTKSSPLRLPPLSPKPTPLSPKPLLRSPKPAFSPKPSAKTNIDANKIRLQQKSKRLVKESLRNARQKKEKLAKMAKIVTAPLLLGDRKRLSRGAKEKVLTYNENSKTKTVNDIQPSESSSSDNESDNESEHSALSLSMLDLSNKDMTRILDSLDEHICLVDGLACSDFDIGNKKFLSNPVSLLYNADIRRAASTCNCLCFYDEGRDWNDYRLEVPQCGVDLRTKTYLDVDEPPPIDLDFSPDKFSKKDRNIFDLITSPNDQTIPIQNDSSELDTSQGSSVLDPIVIYPENKTKTTSGKKKYNRKENNIVRRTSMKSLLKDIGMSVSQNGPVWDQNEELCSNNNAKKRTLCQPEHRNKRIRMDGYGEVDTISLSDSDDLISTGSRPPSPVVDNETVRKNPGKLELQDIDLLMNVCEALEVFLVSDDHLLLDVGGYMSRDQAFMLGYLCDYDVVTADKALKLKRTSSSRAPDIHDLDAIINNSIYFYGAEATRAGPDHTFGPDHASDWSENAPDDVTSETIENNCHRIVTRPLDSDFVFY